MPTAEFTVTNKLGIHARPAAQFVKTASQYSCDIQVEKDDEQADGKSIMGLMMLAAGHGSILIISTDGDVRLHTTIDKHNICEGFDYLRSVSEGSSPNRFLYSWEKRPK